MKNDSPDPPNIDSRRSGAPGSSHGARRSPQTSNPRDDAARPPGINANFTPNLPSKSSTFPAHQRDTSNTAYTTDPSVSRNHGAAGSPLGYPDDVTDKTSPRTTEDLAAKEASGQRPVLSDAGNSSQEKGNNTPSGQKPKPSVFTRFYLTSKMILFHSWVNLLLIFVPIGIVVQALNLNPGLVFAMNAIAIIPLAGLLSHATESVASKLGDTIGALLNVTFGNAVELIIFIALVKNEIRIVQASLLGSILANLLLILGMCFFLGGLRFREQIYNSTVTQMSACLLSLSVISLVLPTAFHASFQNSFKAEDQTLKISRGTSVILLLVYILYLLFQLRSHAYMYESTPQHIVDAESAPGPAIGFFDSSSSEDTSDDDVDSDSSDSSRGTVRKTMRKVMRAGRRRKSSVASINADGLSRTRTSSVATSNSSEGTGSRPNIPHLNSGGSDEVMEESPRKHRKHRRRHHKHKKSKKSSRGAADTEGHEPVASGQVGTSAQPGEPVRFDFADQGAAPTGVATEASQSNPRARPVSGLRGLSIKNFAPAVFVAPPDPSTIAPTSSAGPVPRVRLGIRRTNSLPDRLNQYGRTVRAPGAMVPPRAAVAAVNSGLGSDDKVVDDDHLSRTAAILLLLFSTGLVAVCAEFLVGSINEVVETSPLGEIFIGLIILPIVGNAAEHVTAVTVAMKNKMDLAIGVAVGSSIQIALFITPLVVIIGWALDRDMSLYFTLFETVCLFVSAFIVNFLVLDGRSNYLEGALLCATYIIIAVVAFFYPNSNEASSMGA
ncbi:calcium/proton exchanger [Colletotrichum graminicola]|uniref:Calcium/proton exchanger n=1 Tax=Colletotrichum graminicola (strain M1.001 / M2 / FGSC 10212) TaxID=645133 RepID=E3Q3K2_COLGM|nr:calcium/proton exchanger [Colletotrichum graminicola M1.001]EFQ25604.1 calcium/proton exchanger [Colletotrichum graminicola M1.001]WDK11068.1 calcium/proton exchanger [Colletotrichum graminicola]